MLPSTLTHKGQTFTVKIERDLDHGPPWEGCDGHGIVSDWTTRPKAPSERVLVEDRHSRRYYDYGGTVKVAKRDQWGIRDQAKQANLTKGQIAALATEEDYESLRRWCADEWFYVGVVVTLRGTTVSASLWGIESHADAYLGEVAQELADQVLSEAPEEIQREIDRLAALQARIAEIQS